MSHLEMVQLVLTRLQEEDGKKLKLDMPLILEALEYLLPDDEEDRVLELYRKAFHLVPFRVFNHPDYCNKLLASMESLASEVISDHAAEGQGE